MSDLIIGIHSIIAALKNPRRINKKLYIGKGKLEELNLSEQELNDLCQIEYLNAHEVQEKAKELCAKQDFSYQRVPGNILLQADPLEEVSLSSLYSHVQKGKARIVALDQVTDVTNAAAILRTAAFFNVNYMVFSRKGGFVATPAFFRLASGATEYISVIAASSLPKVLSKLKEKGATLMGFSEDGNEQAKINAPENTCLVLGAEDKGLSNAVRRCLDCTIAITSKGPVNSLNVSVAAAIAMDRVWADTK